jgi:uncharacterized membrane protein HdeD (DUF308 family)
MSTTYERPPLAELRHELAALRSYRLWFVLLGVALVVLGIIALGSPWVAALATAVAIGALLVVSGVVETVGTLWSRGWSGFFVHLLCGVLSIVVGLLFLWAPAEAVLAQTLLLACLLTLVGIFKIAAALNYRFGGWGWPLVSGVIDLLLGVLIGLGWPASGLWALGLFVGIALLFRGLNWIGLGLACARCRPPGRADRDTGPAGNRQQG